ncbi:hypothetical protein MTR67_011951, partial [Solanum verrucosum]
GKKDSDPILIQLKGVVHQQKVEVFSQGGDCVLCYHGRFCVPNVGELRQYILAEAQSLRYSFYLPATKMYHDLRKVIWWNDMKRDIKDFVAKYSNCQQVNVELQKLEGMTQEINIPTCKWEVINMDFIMVLPHTRRQHDSIWVIVERVTKSAHFLAKDGQAKRTIQTLKDMLRTCVIHFIDSLDDHLPLIEFTNNNSFQSCIQMALQHALYGRRCRSHN